MLWGELARLYHIVTNDPARSVCDELLVTQLLGRGRAGRHEVARELDGDAPLVRFGLVHPSPGGARPFLPLVADPIVVARVSGDMPGYGPAEATRVRPATSAMAAVVMPAALREQLQTRLMSAPCDRPIRIVVAGRRGSGRRTLLAGSIDPAFKRRLSFRIAFPFPDEELREKMWRVHLPPHAPRRGNFDLVGLARKYKLTGGYIRNAALRAAFLAAQENQPLTQGHLERAVKLEYQDVGKLSAGGPIE